MEPTTTRYIEIRPNRSDQPRAFIVGTRVRVQDIYAMAELQGLSPDEIVRSLPHLSLAQVHAALAYYFDHIGEFQQEMRDERAFAEEFRRSHPSLLKAKLPQEDLKEAS